MNITNPSELFGYLFMLRDRIHLTHLAQPDGTLATHLALNELYDNMLGSIDKLVELYTGLHGVLAVTIPSTTSSTDILADLLDAYQCISDSKSLFEDGILQGILDEMLAMIAKALYKLKFVK